MLEKKDKIALFGVQEFENVELYDWQATPLPETIHLIRALAKVEVSLDRTMVAEYTLKSVILTRHSFKAAPAPFGVTLESEYVKGNYNDDYTDSPSIPDQSISNVALDFKSFTDEQENKVFAAYIPEYENIKTSNHAQLKVTIINKNTNQEKKVTLEFAKYEDDPVTQISHPDLDAYFNILRNIKYIYVINKKSEDITVELVAVPWEFKRLDQIIM